MNVSNEIMAADGKDVVINAIAAIRRLGQCGEDVAEAFQALAQEAAGDIDFETGYEVINA